MKIWNASNGAPFTTIEASVPVNDVCVAQSKDGSNSGLLMMACEQERLMSFYVPRLGRAPPWAMFLDSITEELEEETEEICNYKFVTKKSTKWDWAISWARIYKSYMHGFFMDVRLYERVTVIEPFAFDKWRKSKITEKREKKRERISVKRALPKVTRS